MTLEEVDGQGWVDLDPSWGWHMGDSLVLGVGRMGVGGVHRGAEATLAHSHRASEVTPLPAQLTC